MVRRDIPPRQIPVQRSAVGTFACTAQRDTSPKGRQKRLNLLYFAFYFSLAFIFLFSFPCPHDGWMQGGARVCPQALLSVSLAPSQPRGTRFLGGFWLALQQQCHGGLCPALGMDRCATTFYDLFL